MAIAAQDDSRHVFKDAAEFLAWVEPQTIKYEMIDYVAVPKWGAVEMMTGGTRRHAKVAANALFATMRRTRGGPCEAYGSDYAIAVAPGLVRFPDVSVTCSDEPDEAMHAPVVVMEVLSPSTAGEDRGEKAQGYRALPSLRHLLLIEPGRLSIEHQHRAGPDELFRIEQLNAMDDVIRLNALNIEVPIGEFYRGVDVPNG